MKQITLAITDDTERLLIQFLHTDHRGTHNPIYLVETQEKNIIYDGGESGEAKYFSTDSNEIYDTPEELVKENTPLDKELVKTFDELAYEEFNDISICDLEDYFQAFEVGAQVVSEIQSYRTAAYFFSEEEAKRYIKYQGHNLNHPRTYAAGPGYSNNGDWDPFYKLLCSIAEKCEANMILDAVADPEQDTSIKRVDRHGVKVGNRYIFNGKIGLHIGDHVIVIGESQPNPQIFSFFGERLTDDDQSNMPKSELQKAIEKYGIPKNVYFDNPKSHKKSYNCGIDIQQMKEADEISKNSAPEETAPERVKLNFLDTSEELKTHQQDIEKTRDTVKIDIEKMKKRADEIRNS